MNTLFAIGFGLFFTSLWLVCIGYGIYGILRKKIYVGSALSTSYSTKPYTGKKAIMIGIFFVLLGLYGGSMLLLFLYQGMQK